tara:strand:+ start:1697 stop:2716 length:1020 start_codon:yes stop_codon:yes gene_type:complete
MKILITGGCGFVGTNVALFLNKNHHVDCLDNLSRSGSKYNLEILKKKKIRNFKFNVENFNKIIKLPKYDFIIDCCAEASVEVSRKDIDRVVNTNFIGTLNILKKAKKDSSKIIFLSSSRVYPLKNFYKNFNDNIIKKKFKIKKMINEKDNLVGPRSIYGFTKLASEMLIEEFSYAFKIKYIINRCGVISGPLQFGKQDQGFVSLWIWNHLNKKSLNYIGFGGNGLQVRDVLHIYDLLNLIKLQINNINKIHNKTFTVGGSKKSFTSLKNLTNICSKLTHNKIYIGKKKHTSNYDIPYYITDNKLVSSTYKWKPKKNIFDIVFDTYKWIINNKVKINKFF